MSNPAAGVSRPNGLRGSAKTMLVFPLLSLATVSTSCGVSQISSPEQPALTDEEFLEELEPAIFRFFWEQASPATGQVKDRAFAAGAGMPASAAPSNSTKRQRPAVDRAMPFSFVCREFRRLDSTKLSTLLAGMGSANRYP